MTHCITRQEASQSTRNAKTVAVYSAQHIIQPFFVAEALVYNVILKKALYIQKVEKTRITSINLEE